MKLALLAATLLLVGAGCASVSHERTLVSNGVVVGSETESAHAFLMKGAIDGISSTTKDLNYSHVMSAKGLQGQGDVEMMKAIIDGFTKAMGTVAAEAAKGAVAP